MGCEFGVEAEWNHEAELDWASLAALEKSQLSEFVARLNAIYRGYPALHLSDCRDDGFSWTIGDDSANSVFAFLRTASGTPPVLAVANFTPVPRDNYRIGVPAGGTWTSILDSDALDFGAVA